MLSSIKLFLITLGLMYLLVCLLMYFKQRSFLYFPTAETKREDIEASVLLVNGFHWAKVADSPKDGSG